MYICFVFDFWTAHFIRNSTLGENIRLVRSGPQKYTRDFLCFDFVCFRVIFRFYICWLVDPSTQFCVNRNSLGYIVVGVCTPKVQQ